MSELQLPAIFAIPQPPDHSWGAFCSKLGKDQCILDFRTVQESCWLNAPCFLLNIGNQFSEQGPLSFFQITALQNLYKIDQT
ncbi:MAG: hypothetical protein ACHQUC_09720 [Chlamydiales bacterium]